MIDRLHDALRASQDFTRWASFAIENEDDRAEMQYKARMLREALDRLLGEAG